MSQYYTKFDPERMEVSIREITQGTSPFGDGEYTYGPIEAESKMEAAKIATDHFINKINKKGKK